MFCVLVIFKESVEGTLCIYLKTQLNRRVGHRLADYTNFLPRAAVSLGGMEAFPTKDWRDCLQGLSHFLVGNQVIPYRNQSPSLQEI